MSNSGLDEAIQSAVNEAKPPLPPLSGGTGSGERSRSRPKSWTSSLFNAMRANHKSVNFQSVLEEQHNDLEGSKYTQPSSASSSGDRLNMLSIFAKEDDGLEAAASEKPPQLKLPKPCSRTPSPFRTIIKGLVKGMPALLDSTTVGDLVSFECVTMGGLINRFAIISILQ